MGKNITIFSVKNVKGKMSILSESAESVINFTQWNESLG